MLDESRARYRGYARSAVELFGASDWRFRRRSSAHKIAKQFDRVVADSADDRNEFDDIEPPLTAFVFGDERLRLLEAASQGMLGKPCSFARRNHNGTKGRLVRRMDGFADAAGGRGHCLDRLIPASDYPKTG
ncbi:hypothetical protein ACVL91_007909 [Bradyrhizobium elkanii]